MKSSYQECTVNNCTITPSLVEIIVVFNQIVTAGTIFPRTIPKWKLTWSQTTSRSGIRTDKRSKWSVQYFIVYLVAFLSSTDPLSGSGWKGIKLTCFSKSAVTLNENAITRTNAEYMITMSTSKVCLFLTGHTDFVIIDVFIS